MTPPDPLVSAAWLAEHIDAPDIRVVDATWFANFTGAEVSAQAAYDASHIPGAVFFDINKASAPDTDLPHMMPDAVRFASYVRKLGLGDGNRIIIYDSNNFFASDRAWWMFRVMGQDEVRVLDGENELLTTLELQSDGTALVPLDSVDHSGGLVIEVDTGGHDNYWILTPDDIAGKCGS